MSVGDAFGDSAAEVFSAHAEAFTLDGHLEFPVGAFLVRSRDRVVLVDAGAGPRDSWMKSGMLLQNLRELGVATTDITDVVYTHLHWDHIGWASQKGDATFGRARHHCHEADWNHFYGRQPGATKRLKPIESRFEFWSSDRTVVPGVDVVHAPGHTPGSSVVVVSGSKSKVALLGDVVHCPFQLSDSEVGFVSDFDPGLAALTRGAIARELEDQGIESTGAHFPNMSFGRMFDADRKWIP